MKNRHWFRRSPCRFAPEFAFCDPYTIAFRSASNWVWSKPLGEPLALIQFCPNSVCASSQYFIQNASVMVFNWPQVMQVKPCWSYLGTKTQCPPQLPGLEFAPPLGTTSHTPWVCAVSGSDSPIYTPPNSTID